MNRQKRLPDLRAQLTDVVGRRTITVKRFDEVEDATPDDAYGGVIAANRVLQHVLGEMADFCVSASVSQ